MVIVGLVLMFVSGWFIGRVWERVIVERERDAPTRIDSSWRRMPSGWCREVRGMTIYAMTQDGNAYWWVSRNGKTLVEGPSRTLETAKVEAEREVRTLSR